MTVQRTFVGLVKLARPAHAIKNALVLFPPFFVNRFFDVAFWSDGALAFLAFSCAGAGVYALNDVQDCAQDRAHPVKCHRPVACGDVSSGLAYAFAVVMFAAAVALALGSARPAWAVGCLAAYGTINVAYSRGIKNVPVADLLALAAGFVLRIFFGGAYFGIPISSWLFLTVLSAAMYFAIGKRRAERARLGAAGETRAVLANYPESFLDSHFSMFAGMSIIFYSLWTILRTGQAYVGRFAWTIPVVIFAIVRYNWMVESGKGDGDPVPMLFSDWWLMGAAGLFVALNFVCLYVGV